MARSLTVYAPASIGNLSVGFDLLGLALQPLDDSLLGDRVSICASNDVKSTLQVDGEFASALPADPRQNAALDCYQLFLKKHAAAAAQPLLLKLTKSLPVGSGLGSSASSVVATLVSLNLWFDSPLSQLELLDAMGEIESGISGERHYDNIAAGFLGGLVLCDSARQPPRRLPWPESWFAIVAYQKITVETRAAREVLPASYSRAELIRQNAALAYFVNALHVGDLDTAAQNMVDQVAEPYRQRLLPGYQPAKEHVLNHGAIAAGISGSGPTMFAIADDLKIAGRLRDWLDENYAHDGFTQICTADLRGARILDGTPA